jgi:hypothetical protein
MEVEMPEIIYIATTPEFKILIFIATAEHHFKWQKCILF